MLDFFGGLIDLRSRLLRVLHSNSFIEDPTRIYRAVRFAVRLHFRIEPQTEEYIRYAIDSGVYERLRLSDRQAPALTTRLRAELKYILQADYWKPAIRFLADLGALRCLHQNLKLTPRLWWEIRCVSRWLNYLDPENKLQQWLMRLETLICSLPAAEREIVAVNLQLPQDSIQRVKQLDFTVDKITRQLSQSRLNSEIYESLSSYKKARLILVATKCSRDVRKTIWRYLTKLSLVQPILNGNDLKELGYKPSPQFKEMLGDLLAATLDNKISNRQEAIAFVREKY